MVHVDVEFCTFCDFSYECKQLAAEIHKHLPEVPVNCSKGRKGTFEVKINDELVYSMLEKQDLPNFKKIVEAVINAEKGKKLPRIPSESETNKSCAIA